MPFSFVVKNLHDASVPVLFLNRGVSSVKSVDFLEISAWVGFIIYPQAA